MIGIIEQPIMIRTITGVVKGLGALKLPLFLIVKWTGHSLRAKKTMNPIFTIGDKY